MKKIAISLILFILILGSALHAKGAEQIIGAFGMELGNVFDPSLSIGKGELTDGTPMYQFYPEKKFRSFDRYYVLITPKTNKIYGIWGIGESENDPKCKKEQALIMELLKQKYAKKEEPGFIDSIYDIERIDQGNRYIVVKCSGFSDVTIDIRYYDQELKELAERERLELEASKTDASGL